RVNGVSLYLVDWPGASPAVWKYPSEMFDDVSTVAFCTGTKLMTLEPVMPVVPTAPEVLYCRMLSCCERLSAAAWGALQASRPRARTAVRNPVHPLVMCIISS